MYAAVAGTIDLATTQWLGFVMLAIFFAIVSSFALIKRDSREIVPFMGDSLTFRLLVEAGFSKTEAYALTQLLIASDSK